MKTNTLKHSLDKRKVRLLLDRELRNKYVTDQIKIGLRNQLRSLRDERKITQVELAKMIGTKQSVISRIERDPMRVGLPVFLDIAHKLDVTLVVRFEAIDTFVEWYDNLTPKKMTPDPSEKILMEKAQQLLAQTRVIETGVYYESCLTSSPIAAGGFSLPFNPDFWKNVIPLENVDVREDKPQFQPLAGVRPLLPSATL